MNQSMLSLSPLPTALSTNIDIETVLYEKVQLSGAVIYANYLMCYLYLSFILEKLIQK
jgi:hypothetical protein